MLVTSSDRTFWVCYRRDTDQDKIKEIQRALENSFFEVFCFAGRNFAEGHPGGCNALWTSAMIESFHMIREGRSDHQALLTFEADCVPLRADWIDLLAQEWRATRPYQVVGHFHHDHINGNAMFSSTLMRDHSTLLSGCLQGGNWDYANRELFTRIGTDTNLITQLYDQKTLSEEDFMRITKHYGRPALLHGVKDLSAQNGLGSI